MTTEARELAKEALRLEWAPEEWGAAKDTLVAQALSELSFEGVLQPEPIAEPEGMGQWVIGLQSGVSYRFRAVSRFWGQLEIDPHSLIRQSLDDESGGVEGLPQLAVDAQGELGSAGSDLAHLLRELQQTQTAEYRRRLAQGYRSAEELASLPASQLHSLLAGHPKAVASRGRFGWGDEDTRQYAPETGCPFRLFWVLAISPPAWFVGQNPQRELLEATLGPQEAARLRQAARSLGADPDRQVVIPIHPWQWDRVIRPQFAEEIAAGRLRPLGWFGDRYRPQPSLRTLANAESPQRFHLKVALSVRNTSAHRGLPGHGIEIAPEVSRRLDRCCREDPLLQQRVTVQQEVGGVHYPHPHFAQIAGSPYWLRESLGALWRESPESVCPPDWQPLLLASTHHTDRWGQPLAVEFIRRSGLGVVEWLEQLFEIATLPFYHLLCRYGVGLIAHGQNVTVAFCEGIPRAVFLKDFQGDLSLRKEGEARWPFPETVSRRLPQAPPDQLIHHLWTAQFASVYRFLSAQLARSGQIAEDAFYRVLARVLRHYQATHPELASEFVELDPFARTMPRVCLNRALLAAGYSDREQRPSPALGPDLTNPLWLAE